ncbi:DUF418 domain-containing protein [uncultured Erythrobacter sp.]|uniref:DUF418 domain-containing protein n=1 Tax=uncultured Erythrobacter sp. TaxID=263913 RepID=UPI00260C668B|nr:DUF418 domain-containing protein [uncultured Erythrobacter sp.]
MTTSNNAIQAADGLNAEAVATDGPSDAARPVATSDRIETLDFIRGIAVMGILLANIVAFGQPFSAYMYPSAWLGESGDPDGWLWIVQFVLIDGKMRALFTVLFGAGLYLFMERAWARGQTRWLQAWRLVVLLVFGLLHFFLLWQGDILALYGMCGLLVVPMLRLSVKRQMGIGVTGYVFGAVLFLAAMAPLSFVADSMDDSEPGIAEFQEGLEQGKAQTLKDDAEVTKLKQAGSYADLVVHRVEEKTFQPVINASFFFLETVPLMLIGAALYRLGFFSGGVAPNDLRKWGWIAVIGGGLASLAIALWTQAGGFTYYGTLAAFMGWSPLPRLAMGLGMAALLVAYSPAWTGWLASRVRAAGRTAFTNYLGTSIVMLFVMHGWALGLFGELNRPQLYLVTLLTCGLMLAWSKPWLDRYRYGPLEWLWRCLIYRQSFANKR